MRRAAYVISAASVLFTLTVHAQEGKRPLIPDRPSYRSDRPSAPTVTEALKALGAITVGDVRSMSDRDLRQLTDLLKQWIDIVGIEERRRNDRPDGKGRIPLSKD